MTGVALTFAALTGAYVYGFGRQQGEPRMWCATVAAICVAAPSVVGAGLDALVRWLA